MTFDERNNKLQVVGSSRVDAGEEKPVWDTAHCLVSNISELGKERFVFQGFRQRESEVGVEGVSWVEGDESCLWAARQRSVLAHSTRSPTSSNFGALAGRPFTTAQETSKTAAIVLSILGVSSELVGRERGSEAKRASFAD